MPRENENWTPGPWKIRPSRNALFVVQPHRMIEEGIYVAEVSLQAWKPEELASPARREADARLIAAAPELYEALKALDDGTTRDWTNRLAKARAALAKARGGSDAA
jgi:hypothetical protein